MLRAKATLNASSPTRRASINAHYLHTEYRRKEQEHVSLLAAEHATLAASRLRRTMSAAGKLDESEAPEAPVGPASHRLADQIETAALKLEAARRAAAPTQTRVCCFCCVPLPCCMNEEADEGCCKSQAQLIKWFVSMPIGVAAILLFYADMAADVAVARSLFASGISIWGWATVSFIGLQYLICYAMVLVYLCRSHRQLHGHYCGTRTIVFAVLGLPAGPMILDVLMFLEPLGLLPALRFCMPEALAIDVAVLIPHYRRARSLVEVAVEGVPQTMLELYIFLRMEYFAGDGFCLDVDRSHAYYEIDRVNLERSLFLTVIAIAKVAFEFLYLWQLDEQHPCSDGLQGVFEYTKTTLELDFDDDEEVGAKLRDAVVSSSSQTPSHSPSLDAPARPLWTPLALTGLGGSQLGEPGWEMSSAPADELAHSSADLSSPFSARLTALAGGGLASNYIDPTLGAHVGGAVMHAGGAVMHAAALPFMV
jgi:hypothetical protein